MSGTLMWFRAMGISIYGTGHSGLTLDRSKDHKVSLDLKAQAVLKVHLVRRDLKGHQESRVQQALKEILEPRDFKDHKVHPEHRGLLARLVLWVRRVFLALRVIRVLRERRVYKDLRAI
jgi:hypothetical protein